MFSQRLHAVGDAKDGGKCIRPTPGKHHLEYLEIMKMPKFTFGISKQHTSTVYGLNMKGNGPLFPWIGPFQ